MAATTQLPPKDVHWSFEGPFGRFDQEQLQRGYKVYHDVCSACHAMNLMSYRNLGAAGRAVLRPEIPEPERQPVRQGDRHRTYKVPDIDTDTGDVDQAPGDCRPTPSSRRSPTSTPPRASNGGALPPDLSLIIKAREGGPRYIYSILTGYATPPAGLTVPPARYYNPYMPGDLTSFWHGSGPVPQGGFIAMPLQLTANRVTFDDGVKAATPDQEAKDVVAFLAWASEPHMEERKQLGFAVMIYLVLFTGLLYASYRHIWRKVAH